MKNYIISFWGIVFIDNAPFVGFLPQKMLVIMNCFIICCKLSDLMVLL